MQKGKQTTKRALQLSSKQQNKCFYCYDLLLWDFNYRVSKNNNHKGVFYIIPEELQPADR